MIYKETNNRFINKIKKALIDYPMTQSELATKLGVAEGTVSRWLHGHRDMSVAVLERIYQILGL